MGIMSHTGETALATDYQAPRVACPAPPQGSVLCGWFGSRRGTYDLLPLNVKFLTALTRRWVICRTCPKSEVDHEHRRRHFDTLQ